MLKGSADSESDILGTDSNSLLADRNLVGSPEAGERDKQDCRWFWSSM